MRKVRLGCFTSTGIIAALITTFFIAGSSIASGGQMFSPGDLNAIDGNVLGGVSSHAEIAGVCSACHVAPWDSATMDDRCVVCHEDVPVQMLDLLTPHGRMFALDSTAACRDCHPEHRGSAALLTEVEGWRYPHQLSGYYLTVHQFKSEKDTFLCADCHGDDVTTFEVDTCRSCHDQIDPVFTIAHVVDYGTSCLECHDGRDSLVTDFTHENFSFKLTGKHAGVTCANCHRNTLDLTGFKTLSEDCASCHTAEDPHQGILGADCASCHTTEGWKPSQFNHNQSAFKLTEAHVNVACENCHVDKLFKGTTPTDCFSCHKQDDPHGGELGTACESCHKATTWQDVNFDHSTSRFALVGRHVDVSCTNCHTDLLFKGTPSACASCHSDVHLGQMGMDCAKCHNPGNWKDINFDHASTGFPLVGSHKGAACTSCHIDGNYQNTPSNCFACHAQKDAHAGQFGNDCGSCHNPSRWNDVNFDHGRTGFPLAGGHVGVPCTACHVNGAYKRTAKDCVACHASDDTHNGQFGMVCSACHDTKNWKNATFDHSKTGFPLTGSHSNANCKSCHANGVFKGTPSSCYACHAARDNHNGQFGTDCGACHTPTKWSDVNFNHNNTNFPLSGKHSNTQCSACHSNGMYKGTPTNCYACHASNDKHNGQFGTNCGACHTPKGWGNSTFTHNNTSFPLVGKHSDLSCSKCHNNGVYKGTPSQCISCHKDEHNGENGTDCSVCHTPKGWGN